MDSAMHLAIQETYVTSDLANIDIEPGDVLEHPEIVLESRNFEVEPTELALEHPSIANEMSNIEPTDIVVEHPKITIETTEIEPTEIVTEHPRITEPPADFEPTDIILEHPKMATGLQNFEIEPDELALEHPKMARSISKIEPSFAAADYPKVAVPWANIEPGFLVTEHPKIIHRPIKFEPTEFALEHPKVSLNSMHVEPAEVVSEHPKIAVSQPKVEPSFIAMDHPKIIFPGLKVEPSFIATEHPKIAVSRPKLEPSFIAMEHPKIAVPRPKLEPSFIAMEHPKIAVPRPKVEPSFIAIEHPKVAQGTIEIEPDDIALDHPKLILDTMEENTFKKSKNHLKSASENMKVESTENAHGDSKVDDTFVSENISSNPTKTSAATNTKYGAFTSEQKGTDTVKENHSFKNSSREVKKVATEDAPDDNDDDEDNDDTYLDPELDQAVSDVMKHHPEIDINSVAIIPRDEWGAVEPKGRVPWLRNSAKAIVSSFTETEPCQTDSDCRRILRDLQIVQMEEHRMPDIQWNFMVGGNGYVYEGRGWNAAGTKLPHYNIPEWETLDVAYIGRREDFTPFMFGSYAGLLSIGVQQGHVDKDFKFHDVNSTRDPEDTQGLNTSIKDSLRISDLK